MKKLLTSLSMILVFSLLLSSAAFAAGTSSDTLVNWDIRIFTPDGATAVLKGNWYYIYTKDVGSIPYVMVSVFNLTRDTDEAFFRELTESMRSDYPDLEVVSGPEAKTIGGRACSETDYTYKVQGYAVTDRRIILVHGGRTYMFTSKEVPSLDLTVGTLLEDTVRTSVFLSDEETPDLPEETAGDPVSAGDVRTYLYCLDSGMPKYWLDLSGLMSRDPVLHCYLRSGDPTFYETWYVLDIDSAAADGDELRFRSICDAYGFDVSGWFQSLTVREDGDGLVLSVVRDESTLAGGAEDNILTGEYVMKPTGTRVVYEYRGSDRQLLYRLEQEDGCFRLHRFSPAGEDGVYILELADAEYESEYVLKLRTVIEEATGTDVSDHFRSLKLSSVEGAVLLTSDSRARGSDAVVPSGTYLFEPRTSFAPLSEGPFTAEELGVMAQQYYMKSSGFFPPEAEVEANSDGSFTIHLYEVVELDGISHTATSAWYTVDAYGAGSDVIYETPVDLRK